MGECEDSWLKSSACLAASLGWKSDGSFKQGGDFKTFIPKNMQVDNLGTRVKIPLANRDPYAK